MRIMHITLIDSVIVQGKYKFAGPSFQTSCTRQSIGAQCKSETRLDLVNAEEACNAQKTGKGGGGGEGEGLRDHSRRIEVAHQKPACSQRQTVHPPLLCMPSLGGESYKILFPG